MKSLKELRNTFNFNPSEVTSRLRYLNEQNIDWNVFLPSKNKNLQRDFVWTLDQKRELIQSILLGRHIPHCAIIIMNDGKQELYQIIDGKQRLSAALDFYNDMYSIDLEEDDWYFSDLPEEYQKTIAQFNFRYYVVYEPHDISITDQEKINWFRFINFAGTPQDREHLDSFF